MQLVAALIFIFMSLHPAGECTTLFIRDGKELVADHGAAVPDVVTRDERGIEIARFSKSADKIAYLTAFDGGKNPAAVIVVLTPASSRRQQIPLAEDTVFNGVCDGGFSDENHFWVLGCGHANAEFQEYDVRNAKRTRDYVAERFRVSPDGQHVAAIEGPDVSVDEHVVYRAANGKVKDMVWDPNGDRFALLLRKSDEVVMTVLKVNGDVVRQTPIGRASASPPVLRWQTTETIEVSTDQATAKSVNVGTGAITEVASVAKASSKTIVDRAPGRGAAEQVEDAHCSHGAAGS